MSVPGHWLLGGWYPRELIVHQQSYRLSGSNANVDNKFIKYVTIIAWNQLVFGSSLPQVVCSGVHVVFILFYCAWWCPTRFVYMNNTVLTFRHHLASRPFFVGYVLLIFFVFCVFIFFLYWLINGVIYTHNNAWFLYLPCIQNYFVTFVPYNNKML
jgi:hypothetical protein